MLIVASSSKRMILLFSMSLHNNNDEDYHHNRFFLSDTDTYKSFQTIRQQNHKNIEKKSVKNIKIRVNYKLQGRLYIHDYMMIMIVIRLFITIIPFPIIPSVCRLVFLLVV